MTDSLAAWFQPYTPTEHDRYHDRAWWLEQFRSQGYTHNGWQAPAPTEPVRLYRGAPADRRDGIGWTDNLAIAAIFALGHHDHADRKMVPPVLLLASTTWQPTLDPERGGLVWWRDVPADALLASAGGPILPGSDVTAHEYVVDTTALPEQALDHGLDPLPIFRKQRKQFRPQLLAYLTDRFRPGHTFTDADTLLLLMLQFVGALPRSETKGGGPDLADRLAHARRAGVTHWHRERGAMRRA